MNLYPKNFTHEFDLFISNLINLYPIEMEDFSNEDIEQRIQRIKNLNNTLNSSSNFNNFCNSKIKVFSHKDDTTLAVSESVFGKSLTLKKIFNNQPDTVKNKLWINLQLLLLFILEEDIKSNPSKQLEDRINKLQKCTQPKTINLDQTKKSLQQLFQTDKLNDTTNNMINDIFKSFEDALSGKDTMENILNLSSELSNKYEDKITNGEIDLNGLVDNLKNNIPGMENIKNIIDPLLKMDGLNGLNGLMGGVCKPEEKVIIDENFSTANIDIGVDTENVNAPKPIIGNMLKAVDGTGLLGMMTGEQSQSFTKLFDVVNKLKDTGIDNKEGLSDLFKNELGIDMDKINQQMSKMMDKNRVVEE